MTYKIGDKCAAQFLEYYIRKLKEAFNHLYEVVSEIADNLFDGLHSILCCAEDCMEENSNQRKIPPKNIKPTKIVICRKIVPYARSRC